VMFFALGGRGEAVTASRFPRAKAASIASDVGLAMLAALAVDAGSGRRCRAGDVGLAGLRFVALP
jgi:hypothetical protein